MTDKPVTTYVVSVFEKPHWRTVLTTKDKAKAFDLAKEIGDKVRIEEITPKEAKTEDGRRLLGGGPGWGKGAGRAEQVRHPRNLADEPLARLWCYRGSRAEHWCPAIPRLENFGGLGVVSR